MIRLYLVGESWRSLCDTCAKLRLIDPEEGDQSAERCSDCGAGILADPKPSAKECENCGGPKTPHAAKCRSCSDLIRGEAHYAWKGNQARDTAKRGRAQRRYELEICERCGESEATDRHHKDGNTGNNERENIALLCRRCHMEEDGRRAGLVRRNRLGRKPPRPCRICKRKVTALRHGRCDACRGFWLRHGRERYIDGVLQVEKRKPAPPKPCLICGRLSKPLRRGRCGACNEYLRRNGRERVEGVTVREKRVVDDSALALARSRPCRLCERYGEDAHHLVPRSQGGGDVLPNLVSLCRGCHGLIENHEAEARSKLRLSLTAEELEYVLERKGAEWLGRFYPAIPGVAA